MARSKRFLKETSDRSGFDNFNRKGKKKWESVHEDGLLLSPDEVDTPPPSDKSLGGADISGTPRQNSDTYSIPTSSVRRVQQLGSVTGFVPLTDFTYIQSRSNFSRRYNSILTEISSLKGQVLQNGAGTYVAPTTPEYQLISTAANYMSSGSYIEASSVAATLSCEVVNIIDPIYGVFYILKELDSNIRGWGSYVVRHGNSLVKTNIQVNHPLNDTAAWDVGSRVFAESTAKFFQMSGTHNDVNGSGTGDVSNLESSAFQEVSKVWGGENTIYSIHGFNIDNAAHARIKAVNAGIDVVLSNGDSSITNHVIRLDVALEATGWMTVAYNTYALADSRNVAVNTIEGTAYEGTCFVSLAGSSNVQGVYQRGTLGKIWIQTELEQSIRIDSSGIGIPSAATAISYAVKEANSSGASSQTYVQVAAGKAQQIISIQCVGGTVLMVNSYGLSLVAGQAFEMQSGSILNLIYNGTDGLWHELSRSINGGV